MVLDITCVLPSFSQGQFLRECFEMINFFCCLLVKINVALMFETLNIILYSHFFYPAISHPEQCSHSIKEVVQGWG